MLGVLGEPPRPDLLGQEGFLEEKTHVMGLQRSRNSRHVNLDMSCENTGNMGRIVDE